MVDSYVTTFVFYYHSGYYTISHRKRNTLSDFNPECVYHLEACACYLNAKERSLDHHRKIFGFFQHIDQVAPLSSVANFSAFFESTHLAVFRYLFGLTGGPQEDVEDLTADTYMRAWRGRSSFHGDEQSALGWIMKIGRRLVIDNYRRRKARPETEVGFMDKLPQNGPRPEEVALRGDEQKLLWSLLQTLPEEQREILILRYLLGWQVKEIAAYLEVPENSISVDIHRSLERLRQRWSQQKEN